MIRFILKKTHGTCDHPKKEDLYTIDVAVPELENALRRGGYDQYAFEQHDLIGVEIIENPAGPKLG